MKLYAYKNGFKIIISQYYINRYWFNPWDKISYYFPRLKNGISSSVFSILIYILTLGLFVFPSLYNFKTKKINHLYIGSAQRFEGDYPYTHKTVSNYRFSKAIFVGNLYFFMFGFLLKLISNLTETNFYNPYTFIFFYIAIFSIIPIPFTYGYELYSRNPTLWITSISIMFFSLLILFIFKSTLLIILTFIISSIIIIFTILWKLLM